MPTVKVYDGNLEDALAVFKAKCDREGVVGAYKRGLSFSPKGNKRRHNQKGGKAGK